MIKKGGVSMSADWIKYREAYLRSIGYEEGKRIGEYVFYISKSESMAWPVAA